MGLTGVCLCSYSSVQLHKKMVCGIIFRKLQLQLHKIMVFEFNETGPNRPETEPNGAKRSRNGPKSSFLGCDGRGFCRGRGGGGGCNYVMISKRMVHGVPKTLEEAAWMTLVLEA